MRRPAVISTLVLAVPIALLAACGSDSESSSTTTTPTTTAEQAYCADVDQLQSDVTSLSDMDIVADGTDAVTAKIDELRADVATLKTSAGEVASAEVDALETSLDDLQTSLDSVSGDLTLQNAAGVMSSAGQAITAGTALISTLEATCS